jgi:hypothetical protein
MKNISCSFLALADRIHGSDKNSEKSTGHTDKYGHTLFFDLNGAIRELSPFVYSEREAYSIITTAAHRSLSEQIGSDMTGSARSGDDELAVDMGCQLEDAEIQQLVTRINYWISHRLRRIDALDSKPSTPAKKASAIPFGARFKVIVPADV